jgi:hypothetical protein
MRNGSLGRLLRSRAEILWKLGDRASAEGDARARDGECRGRVAARRV